MHDYCEHSPSWEDDCFKYQATIEQVEKCEAPVVLRDKFVKATRTEHFCGVCNQMIPINSFVRTITDIFEGEIGTQYFCVDCCDAMVQCVVGDEDALQKRYDLAWADRLKSIIKENNEPDKRT